MTGSFIHTLVTTDVGSGWTEFIPLLDREQSLVVEGLDAIFQQIPFQVLGIDSDNDQFLAQLPRLWQAGEVRPTHRT